MSDYVKVVYNDESRPRTDYPARLARHLFERFGMKPGMSLLEAGCGRGEFLSNFAALGLKASGVDISPEAAKAAPHLDIRVCDIENAPLPHADDTFDVVYSKSFIEHLHAPEKFFREARRVLKPGGMLVTLVPDWESCYKIYFDDHTHKTPFALPALEDLYKICDFERVEAVKFRQLPAVWKYPALNLVCAAIAPFVPVRTKTRFLRWSRELMLVGCGYKRRPA